MISLQGGLTIARMCVLARVSRVGFYRWLTAEAPAVEEMGMRAAIHEVVLDAWSRKVAGWALRRSLAAQRTVAALEQTIAQRQPMPGLVHHSDRGSHMPAG
ncbi:MAG: DDE-type integrase/transposase/recombinase, partial [Terracidiphilus sp.]